MGYHAALECNDCRHIDAVLCNIAPEYQGFAYEGAAMGVCLLDRLQPWRSSQYAEFLSSGRNAFPYLTHVGKGWALARIPGGICRFCKTLMASDVITTDAASAKSVLSCLALDGYGFHQGYFLWESYVKARMEPRFIPAECLPVFRQGLGRSLCFVFGMDGDRIAKAISRFPRSSQPDLWSGVGLAMAYAGGFSAADVGQILQHAAVDGDGAALAQGVAFAVKARLRGGFLPEHTRVACEVVWRQPVETVAQFTDATLDELPLSSMLSTYAQWRARIQQIFVASRDLLV